MPDAPPTHSLSGLDKGLFVAAFGALCVLLAVKLLTTATRFERPGEMTWPATANVYVARRVQQGGAVYGDWRERPHVPAWYGPALYLPVAHIGRWIDGNEHDLFIIGRWISLLSVLGTAGLIVWLLQVQWPVPRAIAVMMGLVFVTADAVLADLDISFRPDAPTCFLTVLGLALAVCAGGPSYLYGSAVAFLLAFLYKQSSVIGPPAVVLWLWLSGRRAQATHYAALTVVLFVGVVFLLGTITSGRYFLNAVEALKGNATLENVPMLMLKAARLAVLPMTVACFAIFVDASRWKRDLVAILFVFTLLLAVAGTYRDGSDIYYYMLPLAIACLLSGRALGRWFEQRSTASAAAVAFTLSIALAAVRYVPEATHRLAELPDRCREFSQRRQANRARADFFSRLADYLNGLSGPVLCQFNTMGVHCPHSILIDTLTFTSMADVGVFDDQPLIDQIRQGRVAAIVLNPRATGRYQSTDMFSRRWREAMVGRYGRVKVPGLEVAHIYRPIRHAAPRPDGAQQPPR